MQLSSHTTVLFHGAHFLNLVSIIVITIVNLFFITIFVFSSSYGLFKTIFFCCCWPVKTPQMNPVRPRFTPLSPFLSRLPPTVLTIYCSLIAFTTYFSVYAYRKPFNVAVYTDLKWFGLDYKVALALAQLVGYVLSKILGIKYVSEVKREDTRRAWYLVGLALFAEVGLILNALLPIAAKPIGLFMTGLPTGMVWGLVVTYLEGRSGTDLMLAASKLVKSG